MCDYEDEETFEDETLVVFDEMNNNNSKLGRIYDSEFSSSNCLTPSQLQQVMLKEMEKVREIAPFVSDDIRI